MAYNYPVLELKVFDVKNMRRRTPDMQATMKLRPQGSLLSCAGNLVPEVAIPGLTKRIAASGNEIVVSFATSWKRFYELGQRYMTLKMKNAHKLIALEDNEVSYYVVSVWKVVFWHLVASTHGISVFQSDQIRLDWTTPGQRSQVGWHALRNFFSPGAINPLINWGK